MSASGSDGMNGESVVVREGGVTVTKTHEAERFPVPAIVFSIRSEHEQRVECRIADRVPEGVSMDNVGFHPEYGSDSWSVENRALVFERDLDPESEIETVYGLRGPDAEAAERFLDEPTIEVWTGGDEGGSFVEDINDQLTRSATLGDSESDGETGSGETDEDNRTIEAAESEQDGASERDGRNGGIDRDDASARKIGTGTDEGGSEGNDRGDNEIDEIAPPESFERAANDSAGTDGNVGDESNEGIDEDAGENSAGGENDADGAESTTGTAMTEDSSTDTETEATASTTAEGTDERESERATTNGATADEAAAGETAVGETADEEALAARLAREVRAGRVNAEDRETLRDALGTKESVTARIEHLRSQVNDVAAYADALEAFLDEEGSGRTLVRQQGRRLDALREDVESVTERAAANRTDVEEVGNEVAAVENDVKAFEAAISDLDEEVERIDERFARIDDRLETVETRSENIEERAESADDRMEAIDDRLSALEASHESDVDDLREEVEALEAWRAQLAGALGAGGGQANADEDESS